MSFISSYSPVTPDNSASTNSRGVVSPAS
jgi:hypothetical protein